MVNYGVALSSSSLGRVLLRYACWYPSMQPLKLCLNILYPHEWGFSGIGKDKSTSMLWPLIVIQMLIMLQQPLCGRNPEAHRCTNTSRLIFLMLFLLIASILLALQLRTICPHPTPFQLLHVLAMASSHNESIFPTMSSSTTSLNSPFMEHTKSNSATSPFNYSYTSRELHVTQMYIFFYIHQ